MHGRRCFTQVLLHSGVMFMLVSGCSALDAGVFYACPQVLTDTCNSALASSACVVENNVCKCTAANNSSACDNLDQQTFANLTGATNENASQWSCCVCTLDSNYCCKNCSSNSTSSTPAVADAQEIVQPTRYFRILLVFVLECNQFSKEKDNLNNSLKQAIKDLTGMPLDHVTVTDTSCKTGQRPYCGVDVPDIRAHHRAKRLAVGGRMKGKTRKKNQKSNSFSSYRDKTFDVTCNSMSANMTVYGKNTTSLEISMKLLRQLQLNNSLVIPLWDGRVIASSFMLSAMEDTSYSLHEAPTPKPKPLPPTDGMPPLVVDLKPMIYAGAAIGGLIIMCVLWQFIKHSWLLSRKKFTPINSDRVDQNKTQELTKQQKIMEAMEENDRMSHANCNGNALTTHSLPQNNAEATKQHHNWSSPGYPARSLVPAYKPTELHNQRTPPRLILDDDASDIGDDRRSIDSASVVNLGDDENLSDILNSDDERVLRPSSGSSHLSQGIRNPGFIEDSSSLYMEETNLAASKMRGKSKSPSLANGSAKLSVNKSDVEEERKGSIISSDLSLDAGEQTVFLPVKKGKNTKKQEKQKKNKSFLSATNADKPIRRSSITPLNEDKGIRRNSATEVKAPQKSLTVHVADGEKRRKSITKATEDDRKIATPQDTYRRGSKITKASALESETKSADDEGLDVGESESVSKNRNGRSPVGTHRKSISIGARNGSEEGAGRNQKKLNVTSATHLNERRKSAVADGEQREGSADNRIKMNGGSIPLDNGHKNGVVTGDGKRKKKKQKAKKENKRKAIDSDVSSSEEAMATLSTSIAGWNVTPATPEVQRRPSAVSQEKEKKAKKKKKRKDGEGKKRKDSEASGAEDEIAEDKRKQLGADIAASETKLRKSLSPDETQKKKKQKEATTSRRKSEIPGPAATPMYQETNGGFVQSAKSLKIDSLAVTPEKKRRRSLLIEDMESKSQSSEDGSRRKSLSPDIPADWRRSGADQNVTRMQPNSISPLPTGYKSPRLIIKPSYHQY